MTKRELRLAGVLLFVSITANIAQYALATSEPNIWPEEQYYRYDDMFLGGALMIPRRDGTGWMILNLADAVITVTEFGPPLRCAMMQMHTEAGVIDGPCVEGAETVTKVVEAEQ